MLDKIFFESCDELNLSVSDGDGIFIISYGIRKNFL